MKELGIIQHIFCYITLGLLCGWYFFLIIITPLLLYFSYCGNIISIVITISLVVATIIPLKYEGWQDFTVTKLKSIFKNSQISNFLKLFLFLNL
jgi:hypothetical protein